MNQPKFFGYWRKRIGRRKDEVSIEFVAIQIAKCFEYEYMLEFDATLPDGQFKKTADNSKMMKLFTDFKFTPIGDGIKKSVNWFVQNYDKCRK